MALLNLPDEILMHIAEPLYDWSLINFSLSCQRLYQIAVPQLEESKSYAQHRTIFVSFVGPDTDIPIAIIDQIVLDPKIAKHVRELNYFEEDEDLPNPERLERARPLFEKHHWLEEHFQQFVDAGILSDEEKEKQQFRLASGEWGISWLILFSMLPNLKKLSFSPINSHFLVTIYILLRYLHRDKFQKWWTERTRQLQLSGRKLVDLMLPSPTMLERDYSNHEWEDISERGFLMCILVPSIQKFFMWGWDDRSPDCEFHWLEWAEMAPGLEYPEIERPCLDNMGSDGVDGYYPNTRSKQKFKLTTKAKEAVIARSNISPSNLIRVLQGMPNVRVLELQPDEDLTTVWVPADEKVTRTPCIETLSSYATILRKVGRRTLERQGFEVFVDEENNSLLVSKANEVSD